MTLGNMRHLGVQRLIGLLPVNLRLGGHAQATMAYLGTSNVEEGISFH